MNLFSKIFNKKKKAEVPPIPPFSKIVEMMFDKSIKSKFTLDYLYAQKDAKVGADREIVLNKLKENFGFKGVMADTFLFNKFIEDRKSVV